MTLQNHLKAIGACVEARKWAGERTAQQAWDECASPDWMMWWVVRTRPEWQQRVVLLMVRELRARTLDRAGKLRDVSAAALDAAESWALNPCEETRLAARSASYAASFAAALAAADAAAYAAYAAFAASYAARSASFAAALAARAAYADAAYTASYAASYAAYAAFAASYAAYADAAACAAEQAQWITATRAEFECPWKEDGGGGTQQ